MLNAGEDPGILYLGRSWSNLRFRDKNTVETFWREIPFPESRLHVRILLESVSLALAMYMNSISTHSHLVLCNKDSAWVWVLATAPQASWYGLIVCIPENEQLASAEQTGSAHEGKSKTHQFASLSLSEYFTHSMRFPGIGKTGLHCILVCHSLNSAQAAQTLNTIITIF